MAIFREKLGAVSLKVIAAILSYGNRLFGLWVGLSVLYLYVISVVPVEYWVGSVSRNSMYQNGGPLLSVMHDEFWIAVAIPLSPIVGAFLLLSLVAWIGLRKHRDLSRRGFWGVVVALLMLGTLFVVPVRSSYIAAQVEEFRSSERDRMSMGNHSDLGNHLHFETMKIYRALHEAGIATWREDPMEVVRHELEFGELRYLHEDDDVLTFLRKRDDDNSTFSSAYVELKNSRVWKEIHLQSWWQDDEHQVWVLQGISDSPSLTASRIWKEMSEAERALPYPYRETELLLSGEFSAGELGPKSMRNERERLEGDGVVFWSAGHDVEDMSRAVRLDPSVASGSSACVDEGPWSEHFMVGSDRYDACQLPSERESLPFQVYRNGEKYAVFYGEAGADGPIQEARVIAGKLALTYRTAGMVDSDVVLGDRMFVSSETVSGARSPFEHNGKVGFVAELGEYDMVKYDGEIVTENFDEIRTLSCCAITSYPFSLYENGVLEFVGRRGDKYFLVEVDLGGVAN